MRRDTCVVLPGRLRQPAGLQPRCHRRERIVDGAGLADSSVPVPATASSWPIHVDPGNDPPVELWTVEAVEPDAGRGRHAGGQRGLRGIRGRAHGTIAVPGHAVAVGVSARRPTARSAGAGHVGQPSQLRTGDGPHERGASKPGRASAQFETSRVRFFSRAVRPDPASIFNPMVGFVMSTERNSRASSTIAPCRWPPSPWRCGCRHGGWPTHRSSRPPSADPLHSSSWSPTPCHSRP